MLCFGPVIFGRTILIQNNVALTTDNPVCPRQHGKEIEVELMLNI